MRPSSASKSMREKASCSSDQSAAPSTSIRIREMMINGAATLGRHDTYPFEDFRKGTRIWIKDPERVWVEAELLSNFSFNSATIGIKRISDGEHINYDPQKSGMPFPCNPAVLLGKDDLTDLSYLHEPAVLNNLRYRFERLEKIYTYCGIVLVAINPYADCSHFYGNDVIQVYQGQGKQVRGLVPHIFAIAEESFFDMREYGKNQSVIVSGESGAGKTVSAKFVMRYLTHVAGGRNAHEGGGIESRVLASNPVMEAIGNARTIRNDNSSRFGKFIQIHFTDRFNISGAQMRTYLLEKSRVVYQSTNERNYHIFYQMTAARDHPILSGIDLDSSSAFYYTNQGNAFDIPGVDDAEEFRRTVSSLSMLLVDEQKQREIFRVLGGILHLGNIGFVAHNEQAQLDPTASKHVQILCSELFEVDSNSLNLWLSAREIRAGPETVRKPLNVQEAINNRDALSKLIYACVFNWVVDSINGCLSVGESKRRSDAVARFVGVLDIYGFETFDVNSFEQFCINYANEKLQQSFNQHVFKLEQAEYEREEISWVRIDYYDNQSCIDLIEARPGLIDYLDEQCKTGRGTDAGWLGQMQNCPKLKASEHLQMPKFSEPSFIVKHFASDVCYNVEGFLEKNKDTVNEQLLEVISKTKFKFLREITRDFLASSSTGVKRKKTVAVQFRDSLKDLITVLSSTRPHYVRCIKPNDTKERFFFEPKRAIQQLRACGVLETVRISATGFPSRWSYEDFKKRYGVLLPGRRNLQLRDFAQRTCEKRLGAEKFALGKTKIFFRTGQVALLEKLRADTLTDAAVRIQSAWRGFVRRRRYLELKAAVRMMQATCRAFLAFRRLKYLQMHRSAIVLQTAVRGHLARRRFERIRAAVVQIQARFRAMIVRRAFLKARYERSAITIQRYFRGFLVRREQVKYIGRVARVQACVRRWLAKRRLGELKREARTVNHWQNLNRDMANKILELKGRLDVATAECTLLAARSTQTDELNARLLSLQTEIESLRAEKEAAHSELQTLRVEFETAEEAKRSSKQEITRLQESAQKETEELKKIAEEATACRDALQTELATKSAELEAVQQALEDEKTKRKTAEEDCVSMREQLVKNADLLTSSAFSRNGSMRGEYSSMIGGDAAATSFTDDELRLLKAQQAEISELRRRLDARTRQNERLENELAAFGLQEAADKETSLRAYDGQKIQHLEMNNLKLKKEVEEIMSQVRKHVDPNRLYTEAFERLREENERITEENLGMRGLLATHFERLTPSSQDSGHWSGKNSEDGGSTVANELDEQQAAERLIRHYRNTLDVLTREINERDQRILEVEKRLSAMQDHTDTSTESSLHSEENQKLIGKLVEENLILQNKLNRQADELAETRAYLRGYTILSSDSPSDERGLGVVRLEALPSERRSHAGLVEVFNIPDFARILIHDLKPRIARQLPACLPAHLLLAAFRYFDHANDETAITGLFTAVHTMLRDSALNTKDMDLLALWFVNTWRLLNLLRQYSGDEAEEEWRRENSEKQNDWCLQNFNFAPIREQLQSRVGEFYTNLMSNAVEPWLMPKIYPAVLQHESVDLPFSTGLSNGSSRKGSPVQHLQEMTQIMGVICAKLHHFGADHLVLSQVFKQIAHWICASALNQLVFRKDLCTLEKAIQIKHNVQEVQNWLSAHELADCSGGLEPLVQACHLMQSRKEESNLDILCGEMTNKLTAKQVISILQNYTPPPGFEEDDVDPALIGKIKDRLAERDAEFEENSTLMAGTKLTAFDCRLFVHSKCALDQLALPSCLRLEAVARLI